MTADVLDRIEEATTALVHALTDLTDDGLQARSLLPEWSRLTVACHLRYGAQALRRVTEDTTRGRPTAFYPHGRDAQRPSTLEPQPGESPAEVLSSLRDASADLARCWREVADWSTTIVEPDGGTDLGPVSLHWLALLRLTEVEVHGTDLGIGLGPWSDLFVREALPMRLFWLPKRRSNHRTVHLDQRRSWYVASVSTDDWDTVVRVNLTGTFLVTRAALPVMREQRSGTVVNISSMAGYRPSALTGPAYSAAKAGVNSFTESINLTERRHGIRACVICPGEVATPILDLRPEPPSAEARATMLQPEDLAETIVFVAGLPQRATVELVTIYPTVQRDWSAEVR